MKAVLHGLAMLTLVATTALCVLVQVDQLDRALDTIGAPAVSASE